MTAEDLKMRIAEAVHVDAFKLDSYTLLEVQTNAADKKIIYERHLLPDERPLLRSRGTRDPVRSSVRAASDLVANIPQFLLVGPYKMATSMPVIRDDADAGGGNEAGSRDSGSVVPADFVEVFVDSVFAGRDAYMDRATFVDIGSTDNWYSEYLGLRSFFKRNRFTNVKGL